MSDSLIPFFLVSDVSESFRLLTKNEQFERIAQVSHQKSATMSESLIFLSFAQVAHDKWANERFVPKNLAKNLKFSFLVVLYRFFLLKNKRFAHSLFFGERCEWIVQVAHQKWAIWAIRSGLSPKISDHEQIAHSLIFGQKNERFAWKTDEWIPSPA